LLGWHLKAKIKKKKVLKQKYCGCTSLLGTTGTFVLRRTSQEPAAYTRSPSQVELELGLDSLMLEDFLGWHSSIPRL
jgi:hypothetical protein